MNVYDWRVCNALALVVLERFAEAAGDGLVGDGNGYDFIEAAADELEMFEADRSSYEAGRRGSYVFSLWVRGTHSGGYEPAQVMQCIIEELIERAVWLQGQAPSKINGPGDEE